MKTKTAKSAYIHFTRVERTPSRDAKLEWLSKEYGCRPGGVAERLLDDCDKKILNTLVPVSGFLYVADALNRLSSKDFITDAERAGLEETLNAVRTILAGIVNESENLSLRKRRNKS